MHCFRYVYFLILCFVSFFICFFISFFISSHFLFTIPGTNSLFLSSIVCIPLYISSLIKILHCVSTTFTGHSDISTSNSNETRRLLITNNRRHLGAGSEPPILADDHYITNRDVDQVTDHTCIAYHCFHGDPLCHFPVDKQTHTEQDTGRPSCHVRRLADYCRTNGKTKEDCDAEGSTCVWSMGGNTCTDKCHPADSIVNVKRSWGGIVAVTMANLKIGDVVESKHGTYEPIIAFSHRDYKHTAEFFQISAGNHTLDISDGHYMYLHDKETLVQPRDVQIGDRLSTGEIVSSIQKVRKIGLIHPHTWSSTLVVNGVQTSTNTEYIDLVVQDFVTVPLMYLTYLLRMPVDFVPGSRLWKSEEVVIMTRDLQNMLRDVVPKVLHPFVAPFVAVPFVVAGLMHGFPEHVAVVCVLVFLNLASTKTVRSKLSKKQSMLSCGAMGFLVLSLLLHSTNPQLDE
jgi:hypothetical protein